MAPSTKPEAPKKKAMASKHKMSKAGSNKPIGAPMTILNTVAALKVGLGEESVERKKLSSLTKIEGKSTIANGLTKLKALGYIVVTPEAVTVTEAGVAAADPVAMQEALANVPTTNDQYHEAVKKQYNLQPKACAIIDLLKDGGTYKKKDVAKGVDCKMNSTFANALTSLRKCGAVEFNKETIHLTDKMFPIQPRSVVE